MISANVTKLNWAYWIILKIYVIGGVIINLIYNKEGKYLTSKELKLTILLGIKPNRVIAAAIRFIYVGILKF